MKKDTIKIIAGIGVLTGVGYAIYRLFRKPPIPPEEYGSFYGIIVGAITGMPIVGEYVYIDGYGSETPSDGSGYFIVNVPPGTYSTLTVGGYIPVSI